MFYPHNFIPNHSNCFNPKSPFQIEWSKWLGMWTPNGAKSISPNNMSIFGNHPMTENNTRAGLNIKLRKQLHRNWRLRASKQYSRLLNFVCAWEKHSYLLCILKVKLDNIPSIFISIPPRIIMLVWIQFPKCRFTLLWLEMPQESAQDM